MQQSDYKEVIDFLFSQLPMFQRKGKAAFRRGLDNVLALDKHLKHPHRQFPTVHIAGTNGKGSVSHILAAVLQTAGYKTGLYTSPHLRDFRERVKINGMEIPENEVVSFVKTNKDFFKKLKPSFFEMTVALAFRYFAEQKVDVAIIETGLGGRLDSTNIICPVLSIITNISFDHMEFLGDTLAKIAIEKAGIIKPHTPVVIGETQAETASVFRETAKKNKDKITFADRLYSADYSLLSVDKKQVLHIKKMGEEQAEKLQTDLLGLYQKKNVITALAAIDELRRLGFKISRKHVHAALENVMPLTGFRGRWYRIGENPLIICDTAHNEAGLQLVLQQIKNTAYKRLHIIIGTVNDKNVEKILAMMPQNATYYFTNAQIPRALHANVLQEQAKLFGLQGEVYSTVNEALTAAKEAADVHDLIFVGGSTFVVAEVV